MNRSHRLQQHGVPRRGKQRRHLQDGLRNTCMIRNLYPDGTRKKAYCPSTYDIPPKQYIIPDNVIIYNIRLFGNGCSLAFATNYQLVFLFTIIMGTISISLQLLREIKMYKLTDQLASDILFIQYEKKNSKTYSCDRHDHSGGVCGSRS